MGVFDEVFISPTSTTLYALLLPDPEDSPFGLSGLRYSLSMTIELVLLYSLQLPVIVVVSPLLTTKAIVSTNLTKEDDLTVKTT